MGDDAGFFSNSNLEIEVSTGSGHWAIDITLTDTDRHGPSRVRQRRTFAKYRSLIGFI